MKINQNIKINRKILTSLIIFSVVLFSLSFSMFNVSADSTTNVCCEQTTTGLFCQNVPANQCAPGSRQAPTSCDSTSYCSAGTCYNSNQGTCLDNTPEIVCNANKGIWSAQNPPQCNLGCCTLGDQAAFVTLTRCKFLSASLGLQTNYNNAITNEVQCVMQAEAQDTGACVYQQDYQTTCKFTTRAICNSGQNVTIANTQFFKDKLCTDPQLGTNCAPTTKTACVPGKDGVYFIDTCGNTANIYDSSKTQDQDYWTNVYSTIQSCNPSQGNQNSKNCGNCNYLQGSICRPTTSSGTQTTYGTNICTNLNCPSTSNGQSYKHGESWCVYKDQGTNGLGNDAVGSQFFKHICENGQEVLEACGDFRTQECIQGSISTPYGSFSQAACRVNRWQDCLAQVNQKDCENTDQRDCLWKPDFTAINNSGSNGACIPKNPPGLQFWSGTDAQNICSQANAQCIVTFSKGLFGGESCKGNCQCLTDSWQKQRNDFCTSLGDCGPKVNWNGQNGYNSGYNITTK